MSNMSDAQIEFNHQSDGWHLASFQPALEADEELHNFFDNFDTGNENDGYFAPIEVRFKSHITFEGFTSLNGESDIQVTYNENLKPCDDAYPSNKCFVRITKSVDEVTSSPSIFISYGYHLHQLKKSACQSKRLKIEFFIQAKGFEGIGLGNEDIEQIESQKLLIRQNQQPVATQCHTELRNSLGQLFVAPLLHEVENMQGQNTNCDISFIRRPSGCCKISENATCAETLEILIKLIIISNMFPGYHMHQLLVKKEPLNQSEIIEKIKTEMEKIFKVNVVIDSINGKNPASFDYRQINFIKISCSTSSTTIAK